MRPVPGRSQEHAHLGLSTLRSYRGDLQAEERRVSYWRRIIQARLDVVRAGWRPGGTGGMDAAHLRPVLTDERISSGRTALMQVLPLDDVPPLPDLSELWERRVDEHDPGAVGVLVRDLSLAEEQLSAYRAALHRQLGEATDELIARYREQPTLCLGVLPLPPQRRPSR